MTPIAVIIGIEETVRMVCGMLEKHAAPNKIPNRDGNIANVRRLGNVEIWFSPDEVGVARFRFVTWDNIDVDSRFDFSDLEADDLNDYEQRLTDAINAKRAERLNEGSSEVVRILNS